MSACAKTEIVAFDALGVERLYEVLRLRSAVFVVEQDCVYQDLDGLDQDALHVLTTDQRGLVAYTRLLAPQHAHQESDHAGGCAIGRVIVSAQARGVGHGRAIMQVSIGECQRRWPGVDIVLHAQSYLLDFYGSLGFVVEGEEFLEDGIPHRVMRLV